MKCYFCFTAPDSDNEVYTNLFKLSLESALNNTSLILCILYDGPTNHKCFDLIKNYQENFPNRINVIPHEFSHKIYLKNAYPKKYLEKYEITTSYDKLAGTFMRLDIPFIERDENFVLYTDIDVYFTDDVHLDKLPKPKYLAASPEFVKDPLQMSYFNAGVLLLNIKNMQEKCQCIFSDLKKGKPNQTGLFDQGFLNQYCFDKMDILPIEYNWKPYWGINSNAKIIHYHGIKPGGNYRNSGFKMNEKTLFKMSNLYPESIAGLIYYIQLFFQENKISSANWLPNFIEQLVRVNQKYISKNLEHVNTSDLKKILKIYLKHKLHL